MPCSSSQVRTQRWQRMHLVSSFMMEGDDLSTLKFLNLSRFIKVYSPIRYSAASSCSSQLPFLKQRVQSELCSESSSSITCLRAVRTFSLLVSTSIPSATGVAHEAARSLLPFTSTTHTRQLPAIDRSGWWHSVGMLKLSILAASRMVVPSRTEMGMLFILRFTLNSFMFMA